jgi:transcriptional regulator with PAS, ATPase and Fis domain
MSKPTKSSKKSGRKQPFLSQLRKKLRIETLESIELRAIRHALNATKDDKLLAAALLGIGKTTLYRRVKEL